MHQNIWTAAVAVVAVGAAFVVPVVADALAAADVADVGAAAVGGLCS